MKRGLFAELRRRNVIRAARALRRLGLGRWRRASPRSVPSSASPEWVARWFVVASAIGFPVLDRVRLVLRVHARKA
jgi:hypothetical protein